MNETTLSATGPAAGEGMDRRIEHPHAGRNRVLLRAAIGTAVALVAALIWFVIPESGSLTVAADHVRTGEVVRAPFRDYVPLRAKVEPLSTTFVASVAGGQVDELIASDGALVTTGEALVRLANPSLELEVASRSADIAGQLGNVSGQRLTIQRSRFDNASGPRRGTQCADES